MKRIIIVLLGLFGTFMLNAQNPLIESESIIGVWRQVIVRPSADGKTHVFKTGNYKVVNADGTYFTLITWGSRAVTKNGKTTIERSVTNLGHFGTYTNLKDSSFTEHIVKHGVNPKMSGTTSELRYKMIDRNTVIIKYKNGNYQWIPETWQRVVLPENNGTPVG